MRDTTTPTPRRSPLWMRVLLGVSLALNLAIVGLAVGAMLRVIGPGGPPRPPESFGGSIYRALEPEDRRAMNERVRQEMGPRGYRHEDVTRLADALRADPFDPAAVGAVLDAQSASRQGWRQALQASWLDQVAAMSVAQRQAYADRVEQEEQRRKHHRHKKKDRNPDGKDQGPASDG